MAVINLLPNGSISNDWTLSAIGTAHGMLASDHTGNAGSAHNHLYDNTAGTKCVIEFLDFSESFSSIDSVQAVTRSHVPGRGNSFNIGVTILDGSSGTFWSQEVITQGANAPASGYSTQTFTNRTTSDGSSAWTNTNINNLRMEIELTAVGGGNDKQFCHCYFIVTYTEPTAQSTDAIFFGTNF